MKTYLICFYINTKNTTEPKIGRENLRTPVTRNDHLCRLRIEKNNGGNGISGNDETSENFDETWNIVLAPELGCTNSDSPNHNTNAVTSNETCITHTIEDIYTMYGNVYLETEYKCLDGDNVVVNGVIPI